MSGIFAVVATWNGEHWVDKCLGSLRRSTVPVEIVVVDNASKDRTRERVRREFPEATCLQMSENLGFGRANNVGIRLAYDRGADHMFLLNQDAWVVPETIESLVRLQKEDAAHGILSPIHLDGGGRQLDKWFSVYLSKSGDSDGLLSDLLCGRNLKSVYDTPYINAAAWLVSRKCIETVGLFNPVFQHYSEDMEYASRVIHHGLRIGVAPGVRAFHGREGRDETSANPMRKFTQDLALIRYRLARFEQSTPVNILSVLSYLMFAGIQTAPWHRRLTHKAALLLSIIREMPRILRSRRTTARPGKSFFIEAASDAQRYIVNHEERKTHE